MDAPESGYFSPDPFGPPPEQPAFGSASLGSASLGSASFGSSSFGTSSVAPPGWTAPAPPPPDVVPSRAVAPIPAFGALTRSTAADAAVRWRILAAIADNFLIYGGYLVLCAVVHWRAVTASHLGVLVLLSVAYHFAFEAASGQTVAKRWLGIRVLSADGGPADAKAIALRSVLRIIDQLPIWYASGLVNMIRTGPERRQRIGDVAANTIVVAVDGRAISRGTPGWYLPTATLIAAGLSAMLLINLHSGVSFMGIQLTSGGNEALTAQQRAGFLNGCESTGGPATSCMCVLNQLEADGYGTTNRMRLLLTQLQTAMVDRNPQELPPEMVKAARVCGA